MAMMYISPFIWVNETGATFTSLVCFQEADRLCQFKSRLKTHVFDLA